MLSKILVAMAALFAISACSDVPISDKWKDENQIGEALKDMTTLNDESGHDKNKIVIYDKLVGRIHQFDLNSMTHVKSLSVRNPEMEHKLLYDQNSDYVVDFTLKQIDIYDSSGKGQPAPLQFVGTPKSAAFKPSLGLLVFYDSQNSVGMLKLDAQGRVLKQSMRGAVLPNGATLVAGDVDADGRLLLADSKGELSVIDIEQSMDQNKWVYAIPAFDLALASVKWVAPVRGDTTKVFVATTSELAVVDLTTQTVAHKVTINSSNILKYSKNVDPHILVQAKGDVEMKIYHVAGGQVAEKTLVKTHGMPTRSRLDLVKDQWTIVDALRTAPRVHGTTDDQRGRLVLQWRFSGMDALVSEPIKDQSVVELASQSVFQLFASPMGLAENFDWTTNVRTPIQSFNLKYMP